VPDPFRDRLWLSRLAGRISRALPKPYRLEALAKAIDSVIRSRGA
jgi:hypothetical protein